MQCDWVRFILQWMIKISSSTQKNVCLFEKVEFFVADVDSFWTPFGTSGTFGAKIATHCYQCKVIAKCVFQSLKKTLKLLERDG